MNHISILVSQIDGFDSSPCWGGNTMKSAGLHKGQRLSKGSDSVMAVERFPLEAVTVG